MVEYRNFSSELIEEVKEIYRSEGWTTYLADDVKLASALDNSSCLGAFNEDGGLVGFVRCVGDFEHIVMVQDLIVAPEYQKQGIGRTLFKTVWNLYSHVRMFQVNTDLEDKLDNHFYRSFGMKTLEEMHMISYCR